MPQVRPRARGARFARHVERAPRVAFRMSHVQPACFRRAARCPRQPMFRRGGAAPRVPRRRQVGCSQRSNSGQPTAAWYVLVCPLWLPPRDYPVCPPPLMTFQHTARTAECREGRYAAKVRLATPAHRITWECQRCGVRPLGECGRPRCAADRAASRCAYAAAHAIDRPDGSLPAVHHRFLAARACARGFRR